MKRIIIFLFLSLSTCASQYEAVMEFTGEYVSSSELEYLINQGEDIVILDLRSKREYDSEHIVGAINLPKEDIEDIRNTGYHIFTIVIYHSNTAVQKNAYENLLGLGYEVYQLAGGYDSWDGPIEYN